MADAALKEARAAAPGLEVEVYLSRARDRGIELKEGRPEILSEAAEEGLGLRLGDGERMAFVSAGGLAPGLAADLARRAAAQLPLVTPDASRRLPEPGSLGTVVLAALPGTLEDPGAFAVPLQSYAERLRALSARAKRADRRVRKVLQAGFGESFSEMAIASVRGVRAYERGSSQSVGVSVVAGAGSEIQVGSGYTAQHRPEALSWEQAADDAVFRATVLLGAKKLPTKRRDVLFDPWVAGDVLDLLAGPLSAEAVQRGRSLLKGRLGMRVASRAVTLVDDPHLPGGLASALYDDEGLPTRTKLMVEKGMLKDYFFDSATAAKAGRASNGSAARGGYRGLPGPSPTNLHLRPGRLTREALLKDTADGILVFEIMGMHTADPVSGEFSVGVSGVAVRRGELTHGIRGGMLSGNVLQLFGAVDAVADDLVCYGSLAAPTFRVAKMTVA